MPTEDQLNELTRLCDAWLRGYENVPNCELINEVRMAWLVSGLLSDYRRLLAWVKRTADDEAGGKSTGYHAKRIRLEAKSVLRGETIPRRTTLN